MRYQCIRVCNFLSFYEMNTFMNDGNCWTMYEINFKCTLVHSSRRLGELRQRRDGRAAPEAHGRGRRARTARGTWKSVGQGGGGRARRCLHTKRQDLMSRKTMRVEDTGGEGACGMGGGERERGKWKLWTKLSREDTLFPFRCRFGAWWSVVTRFACFLICGCGHCLTANEGQAGSFP